MATSGSVTTTAYSGRYYQLDWSASQSTANNTSTITWSLKAVGGSSSWYAERALKVVIGGKTVYTKTNRVERYTGEVATGTTDITHNDDGEKSFSISVQAAVFGTEVNCKGSQTFELTPIARKSTLSASNGTLGTSLTLSVTRKVTSFTHTITYKCGSASGTICTKSSSTSVAWTTSNGNTVDLASQNTTGESVSVTFTITTYNGSTIVGSDTKKVTMSMPSSVKPSCSISVSDSKGYYNTFLAYVKGKSKLSVTVSPTLSYSSPISAYKTTVDSKDYTTASFTTDVLNSSGTLTISAKVTDKRGRSGTGTTNISVLDYAEPVISKLTVHRCKSLTDGTESPGGAFVKVTYSGTITSLNSKNSKTWQLKYKKYSASSYSTVTLNTSSYAITDGSYIFAADTDGSYDVQIVATDYFSSTTRATSVSSGFTLMHWRANGKGIGFGKVAEFDGLDVDFVSRFSSSMNIGKKTGYLDGKQGVHINKEGYIHLQRTGGTTPYHPYIAFMHDAATSFGSSIRYNYTSKNLEFRKAAGYAFDSTTFVGETKEWEDGKPGTKLSASGGIVIQRISGESPYLDFRFEGTTNTYDSRIKLDKTDKYMEFIGADRYSFDNSIYSTKGLGLGVGDTTGKTTLNVACPWADSANHNIITRNSDGLTLSFGWAASSSYKTVTNIRGQTVQCNGSTTWSSDQNLKHDIRDFDEKYDLFYANLKPRSYKYDLGSSGRTHIGYVTQEVEEALAVAGLTTQDFAGVVIKPINGRETEEDENGNVVDVEVSEDNYLLDKGIEEQHNLAYIEFIALNTYMIQKLRKENTELTKKVNDLEERLAKLEALMSAKTV